jgi:hypothetical protein
MYCPHQDTKQPNVAHHPPQITSRTQPVTSRRSGAWALLDLSKPRKSKASLGFDVLVEMENVLRIVLLLDLYQAIVVSAINRRNERLCSPAVRIINLPPIVSNHECRIGVQRQT